MSAPKTRVPLWWQRLVRGDFKSPQESQAAMRQEQIAKDGSSAADRFLISARDGPQFDAPRRLAKPSMFTHDPLLRQWDKADWQQVDIRLQVFAAVFQELMRKRGVPCYVHSAFRTKSEQDREFAEGDSKVKWPNSAHNIGEAVDIVHSAFHWSMTDSEWQYFGVVGREAERLVNSRLKKAEQIQLVWGGDEGPGDKFRWDPAHWELADYRRRSRPVPTLEPVRQTPRGLLAKRFI